MRKGIVMARVSAAPALVRLDWRGGCWLFAALRWRKGTVVFPGPL
jgi:hypothetical protein